MFWFQELLIAKKILDASNSAAEAARSLKNIEAQNKASLDTKSEELNFSPGNSEAKDQPSASGKTSSSIEGMPSPWRILSPLEARFEAMREAQRASESERQDRITPIPPTLGQQLIDLQKARQSGAITEQEYRAQKFRMLGNAPDIEAGPV